MKEYKGWWTPDYCHEAVDYVVKEWDQKGSRAIKMLDRQRTVLQAGGNLGVFAKQLSKIFDTVFTFEPIDHNFECMVKNLAGIDNIQMFEQGLSDHKHFANIDWKSPKNSGAIRLTEDTHGMSMVTIDSLELTNLDLIWLDLEGFEYKALQGAKQTLETHKPVLIVENNGLIHEYPSDLKGSVDFRTQMLEEFNYVYKVRMMRDDLFVHKDTLNAHQ